MTALAYRAQQFTADVMLAGAAVAHDALAGADHGDAHAVEHVWQLPDRAVDPAAGLALPIDVVNHLVAGRGVLELDADLALNVVLDRIALLDVPFVLEHLCDAEADLASRNENHPPANAIGVADSGQHVRDGVLVVHRFS